jgi:glycosyltransferase involved in cell wall biosynthesis
MKVSICVPTFNNCTYLPEMIDSVIRQTYKDWELVLVDDGSTDYTPKLMKFYTDKRIKYIYRKKNMGISYTRNEAVMNASGDYIAVMDSDDIMLPQRISMNVKMLEKNDVDFVYSSYFMSDANGHPLSPSVVLAPKELNYKDVMDGYTAPHISILAKKRCFKENGYNNEFRVNDDLYLVMSWLKAGYKYKQISKPLLINRILSTSVSRTRQKEVEKVSQEIKEMFKNELK